MWGGLDINLAVMDRGDRWWLGATVGRPNAVIGGPNAVIGGLSVAIGRPRVAVALVALSATIVAKSSVVSYHNDCLLKKQH